MINGEGSSAPSRKTVRNQHGDPRFLEVMLKCNEARRTMLALDPPMRIAPVTPDGLEPFRLAVANLDVSELRLLKRVGDRAKVLTHQPELKHEEEKNENP